MRTTLGVMDMLGCDCRDCKHLSLLEWLSCLDVSLVEGKLVIVEIWLSQGGQFIYLLRINRTSMGEVPNAAIKM